MMEPKSQVNPSKFYLEIFYFQDGAESIINPRNKVFYTKIDEDPVDSRTQFNLQVNRNVANSHSDIRFNPYSGQEEKPPPLDGMRPLMIESCFLTLLEQQ